VSDPKQREPVQGADLHFLNWHEGVFLHRSDLSGLDEVSLPGGYEQRPFEPAHVDAWLALIAGAFQPGEFGHDFDRAYLQDRYFRHSWWDDARATLAWCGGDLVACSTAFEQRGYWPHSGQLDWVVVDTGHRRQGLGRYVVTRALRYFADHGYRDAVLTTRAYRHAALALYMSVGFDPVLTGADPSERKRWEAALEAIRHPEWCRRIRGDYERIARR
jgi:ribosomal protein S18 acetylase RimI-like enzyme